jgi:succinate dehydrogenase / fumarate reductase, cytochrome b subunit
MNPMRNHFVRSTISWMDIRGRGWGMFAFVVNRVTGIGLVAYLLLHFAFLTMLAAGAGTWELFVTIAKSPLFLMFDLVLFAGLLLHGLNGIRLALIGFGIGIRRQQAMFVIALAASIVLILCIAIVLFGGAA